MRRREFITILFSVATWPFPALSQQSAKLPMIGFMGASTRSAIERYVAALVQRLNELGWIDHRTIAIEYRWADGQDQHMRDIAAEFVRMKVDVLVTHGTAAVMDSCAGSFGAIQRFDRSRSATRRAISAGASAGIGNTELTLISPST
jgi:hypothetical protein